MSLRFPFLTRPASRPVIPLGGSLYRQYPIFAVTICGPAGATVRDGRLDTGADDTIFPETIAHSLGIDLHSAPEGEASAVGGAILRLRYAFATLRVTDFKETCEWQAIIGFAPFAMSRMLFGQTGFLQFFSVSHLAPFREVVLEPIPSLPGEHVVH